MSDGEREIRMQSEREHREAARRAKIRSVEKRLVFAGVSFTKHNNDLCFVLRNRAGDELGHYYPTIGTFAGYRRKKNAGEVISIYWGLINSRLKSASKELYPSHNGEATEGCRTSGYS